MPKRSRVGRTIAIVAVVVVLAAGGGGGAWWWWWSHRGPAASTARTFTPRPGTETAHTVAIHITATPDVEVSVDGKRAGRTPLTLDHARGTTPIAIGLWNAKGAVVEVVPDRDREIDLSKH